MAPPTILVVEDDFDIQDALCDLLADFGYAVTAAANGQEALDQLKACPLPAAILCDLLMPVMGGEQLVEEVRKMTGFSVPVVFMSGMSDSWTTVGVTVLKKPFTTPELLAALEEVAPLTP
jgi:two-component system, cell cycle response regulator CpdR